MGALHSLLGPSSSDWSLAAKSSLPKSGHCQDCGTLCDEADRVGSDGVAVPYRPNHHAAELYGVFLGPRTPSSSFAYGYGECRSAVGYSPTADRLSCDLATQLPTADVSLATSLPQRTSSTPKGVQLIASLLRHADFRKHLHRQSASALKQAFLSADDDVTTERPAQQQPQTNQANLSDDACVQLEGCHIPGCLFVEHGNLVFQAIDNPYRLPVMLTTGWPSANQVVPGNSKSPARNRLGFSSRKSQGRPRSIALPGDLSAAWQQFTMDPQGQTRDQATRQATGFTASCFVCSGVNGDCEQLGAGAGCCLPTSGSSATPTGAGQPHCPSLTPDVSGSPDLRLPRTPHSSTSVVASSLETGFSSVGNGTLEPTYQLPTWRSSRPTTGTAVEGQSASRQKRHPPPPLRLSWPLVTLRCFAFYDDSCLFKLEAGRRAPRGEGHYLFRVRRLPEFRRHLERCVHRRRRKSSANLPCETVNVTSKLNHLVPKLSRQPLDEAEEEAGKVVAKSDKETVDEAIKNGQVFSAETVTGIQENSTDMKALIVAPSAPVDSGFPLLHVGDGEKESTHHLYRHNHHFMHNHHRLPSHLPGLADAPSCCSSMPIDTGHVESHFKERKDEAEIYALPDPPPRPPEVGGEASVSTNLYDNVDSRVTSVQLTSLTHPPTCRRNASSSLENQSSSLRSTCEPFSHHASCGNATTEALSNRRSSLQASGVGDLHGDPATPAPPPVSRAPPALLPAQQQFLHHHRVHQQHLLYHHHHLHHHHHHHHQELQQQQQQRQHHHQHPRHASLPIALVPGEDDDLGAVPAAAAAWRWRSCRPGDLQVEQVASATSPYYNMIGIKPAFQFRRIQSLEHAASPPLLQQHDSSRLSCLCANNEVTTRGLYDNGAPGLWQHRPRSSQALFHADTVSSPVVAEDPLRRLPLREISPPIDAGDTNDLVEAESGEAARATGILHYATLDFTSWTDDQPSSTERSLLISEASHLPRQSTEAQLVHHRDVPTEDGQINCSLRVYGTLVNDLGDLVSDFPRLAASRVGQDASGQVADGQAELPANYVAICQLQTLAMRAVLNATT